MDRDKKWWRVWFYQYITDMKTKKDLIFPPIPNEFSVESRKFFESLFKTIKEMNQNIFTDLQGVAIQTTDTMTTSNREGFKGSKRPTNPAIGYVYLDMSGETKYLCICSGYAETNGVKSPVWHRVQVSEET